jgi:hypothetical protein
MHYMTQRRAAARTGSAKRRASIRAAPAVKDEPGSGQRGKEGGRRFGDDA